MKPISALLGSVAISSVLAQEAPSLPVTQFDSSKCTAPVYDQNYVETMTEFERIQSNSSMKFINAKGIFLSDKSRRTVSGFDKLEELKRDNQFLGSLKLAYVFLEAVDVSQPKPDAIYFMIDHKEGQMCRVSEQRYNDAKAALDLNS